MIGACHALPSPRPRFTVRWPMIAEAVVAVACGVSVMISRAATFRGRAAHFEAEI